MKYTIFLLFFLTSVEESTEKRHKRKVAILPNSSDVKNQNLNCHHCRITVDDSEEFILSTNNASGFYELIYGWTIKVPPQNEILLTFSWPNQELSHNKTSSCESCKPYFEIIYGYSSSESTFKIDKFYNIRQLKKLIVPSWQAEIRFFSAAQCNESEELGNAGFAISFKAIPLEQTWTMYALLSVLIPTAFIILGVAYFCVTMKKKEENNQNVSSLPIPIYVDLDVPGCEFKKSEVKEKKENRGRGLRLRTHPSFKLEEPKAIRVISSLVETDLSESSFKPEDLITPVTEIVPETKKNFLTKRFPPKVNLLKRYPKSTPSTPTYANFQDEAYDEDRLSKSEDILYEKRKVSGKMGTEFFSFDKVAFAQADLDTSVFLRSSSGDGLPDESVGESPFVSPK